MSQFSTLFGGGGGGGAIGSYVAGNITGNSDYLLLDGSVKLKADYPMLDTSTMASFEGSTLTTGPVLGSTSPYSVIWCGNTTWYAIPYTAGTSTAYKSTDNGNTWNTCALPGAGNTGVVNFVNNTFFYLPNVGSTTQTSTIYTSTDGNTWTARNINYNNTAGAVGYINGRYVIMPTYNQSGVFYAMWSTDLSTWTHSNGYTPGATASTYYYASTNHKRAVQSKRSGIVIGVGGVGTNIYTLDGLTLASHLLAFNNISNTPGVIINTAATETLEGNLRMASYLVTGLGGVTPTTYLDTHPSLGTSPLPRSNIVINGTSISETHGISLDRSISITGSSSSCDFSGTRLLDISSNGQVKWIDVSNTYFRVPLVMQQAAFAKQINPVYMKAR
jgi:hypothetical protein